MRGTPHVKKIFRTIGKCIMPTEGIFARVLKGGIIKPGDEIIYDKSDMYLSMEKKL